MRLLLDTHVLLWLMDDSPSLSADARAIIDNADEVYVSAASVWELAIKVRANKLRLELDDIEDQIASAGFEELPVRSAHALGVAQLPLHHADPFDRILIAQAAHEPLRLLTVDKALAPYGEMILMAQ